MPQLCGVADLLVHHSMPLLSCHTEKWHAVVHQQLCRCSQAVCCYARRQACIKSVGRRQWLTHDTLWCSAPAKVKESAMLTLSMHHQADARFATQCVSSKLGTACAVGGCDRVLTISEVPQVYTSVCVLDVAITWVVL